MVVYAIKMTITSTVVVAACTTSRGNFFTNFTNLISRWILRNLLIYSWSKSETKNGKCCSSKYKSNWKVRHKINISKQILHDLENVKDSANDDTYQGHMDQLFRHRISTPLQKFPWNAYHTIMEVSLITFYTSDITS